MAKRSKKPDASNFATPNSVIEEAVLREAADVLFKAHERIYSLRLTHRAQPLDLVTRIHEVVLAVHASVLDEDWDQLDDVADVARRILRKGSASARVAARMSDSDMAYAADWGAALIARVRESMNYRSDPRKFASRVAPLMFLRIPAFRCCHRATEDMGQWFADHPEKLAIEDPAKLAVRCCQSLGMSLKTARNAIDVSVKARNDGKGRRRSERLRIK